MEHRAPPLRPSLMALAAWPRQLPAVGASVGYPKCVSMYESASSSEGSIFVANLTIQGEHSW